MPNLIVAERQRRISKAIQNVTAASQPVLPNTGLLSWTELKPFVPFSRRSLTIYMNQDPPRFPRGVVIGGRLCWRAETFRRWLDEVLPVYGETEAEAQEI